MHRVMAMRVSAAWVLSLGLAGGCQAPAPGSDAGGVPASGHSEKAEADPLVGYDLRRLRPREQEPLADMFERVAAEARGEGKRVVVLFSADWCEPCKHLDLELGNTHPQSMIGGVRILELKEDDWSAAARMDEFNNLRRRWEPALGSYPLMILLDEAGKRSDEMKEAKDRLEQQGLAPTLPIWFESVLRSQES
jgi:thiol-disulfide isomerase/thioredoxin